MKRIITGVVAAALIAGAAWAVTPPKVTKSAPKGEEYHHLLMLDLQESAEHARILRHYAETNRGNLQAAVVEKHVAEIEKNLAGVRTELNDLEQHISGTDRSSIDSQLASIRAHEQTAQEDLATLKAEAAKTAPNATVVAEKAKAIYTAMSAGNDSHRRAMAKRNVKDPAETLKPANPR